MELKILQKKEEPLLSRTRIESEIIFEKATPSGQEVKSMLAKNLGKDEKLLDVKSIYTKYGLKKATILCYAYENEEILKRIKVETKKKEGKEGKKEEVKEETKKEVKAEVKEEKQKAKKQKPEEKKETKQEKQGEKKEPEKKEQ